MASSKDDILKEGAKASLEKVKQSAEKLKAVQDNISPASVVKLADTPKQAAVFKSEAAAIPNPAAPMDHSVLENIGIVGAGKLGGSQNIASSSVASVSALSDATKKASQKSLLPKGANSLGAPSTTPSTGGLSSGIQVDSDYKPAFQSQDRATLAASMDKPKTPSVGTSATPSLQSRLQSDQGNLYRAAAGKPLQNNQPLGGGFRMSTDPNALPDTAASSVSTPVSNRAPQTAGGQSSNKQDNGAQIVHHHEDVKGKSGIGAGALGMLGLLLIGGGGAAVVMKPDLLSTTGITSSKTAAVQPVSAPDALIPQVSEVYAKPAPIAQAPVPVQNPAPVQNQRVAAVAVITPPAQPSAPVAMKIAVVSTERFSETGKDVPLKLNADALKVKKDQYIRIGGMPDGATLSSGVDMGDGNWLVAPDAIKTITFTAPEGYKGTLELYMQKIKDDARSAVGTPKTFKVYIGEKPKQIIAAAPQAQQPVMRQPVQVREPKVAAYNPAVVQPAPAAKPQIAPEPIRAPRQIPILPEGISEADENDGFGALPTVKTSRYKRPTARRRAVAPARAPRNLREALPVGRTFSKENYGDTTRPIQQQRVASASPVRSIPQVSPQRAKTLLKRGNNLYRLGDLISARALYGQIAAGGNAEAALAMGRTYDPIYFEKLGVQGFQPEPNRALEWYKKAKSAGLAKAQGKIDNLNYYLNQ